MERANVEHPRGEVMPELHQLPPLQCVERVEDGAGGRFHGRDDALQQLARHVLAPAELHQVARPGVAACSALWVPALDASTTHGRHPEVAWPCPRGRPARACSLHGRDLA